MSQERTKRRRTHRSPEERRALVAAWKSSGLSARAFEKREGIAASLLHRWKHQADASTRTKSEARPSISFAPVHIAKPQVKTMVVERVLAEVVVGLDVRVRVLEGVDVEQVAQLVRALAGGVAC